MSVLIGLLRINTFKGSYGIHLLWLFLAAIMKNVRTLLDINLAGLLIRAFCKCCPCAFIKRELVSYPVDQEKNSLCCQSGIRACVIHRPPCVHGLVSVMAECVFIFEKHVFLECLFVCWFKVLIFRT